MLHTPIHILTPVLIFRFRNTAHERNQQGVLRIAAVQALLLKNDMNPGSMQFFDDLQCFDHISSEAADAFAEDNIKLVIGCILQKTHTFSYRGKAYCASKQIPEKILLDLIANVLGISPILDDQEALDSIHHIEMHPNNRVLFVFQDGHTEEHFWKDHSRKDSWDAEKRKKAAEKTKEQRKRRKEQTAQ